MRIIDLLTKRLEEIRAQLGRIRSALATNEEAERETLAMMAEYDLLDPEGRPEPDPVEPPPAPEPEPEPVDPPPAPEPVEPDIDENGRLMLEGLPYAGLRTPPPAGATYPQGSTSYGTTGPIVVGEEIHGVRHGIVGSDLSIKAAFLHTIGGDAIKCLYGSFRAEMVYATNLGREHGTHASDGSLLANPKGGAHADGIQNRGNLTTGYAELCFFDMENDLGNGSRSNANILIQSAEGDCGSFHAHRCLFFGGNYTIVTSAKKTDNKVCDLKLTECDFIVDEKNPRFGLLRLEGGFEGRDNRIYYRNGNGILRLVWEGDDPRDWNGSFAPIVAHPGPDPEPAPEPAPQPSPQPDPEPTPIDPTEPLPPVQPGGEALYYNEAWTRHMPVGQAPPPVPSYQKPLEQDLDFVIEGDKAISPDGLHVIDSDAGDLIKLCYEYVYEIRMVTRDYPVRIGIRGDAGQVFLACGYNDRDTHTIAVPVLGGGYADLHLVLQGLDPSAKAHIRFANMKEFGRVQTLHVFDMGLVGAKDSMCIRANAGCGEVIFDGHWYLANPEQTGNYKTTLHIDNYETLIIRNQAWSGLYVTEHSTAYIKCCIGDRMNPRHGTWIQGNDLSGGGRTGFQRRPGADEEGMEAPVCAFVVCDNYGTDFAWGNPIHDGGGVMTVWSAIDDPVYIFDNSIQNARYACLAINGQGYYKGVDRNWYNENGFPLSYVAVWGNTFSNPESKRECVMISSVEDLHLYDNHMPFPESDLFVLNHQWAMNAHGIRNGNVYLHSSSLQLSTYVPINNRTEAITSVERDGYLAAAANHSF